MALNDGNIVKRTSQYIDNIAFDEETGLPMTEITGTDGNGNVYRAEVDSTGALKVAGSFSASVTSTPTFKEDPTNAGETPKYGKVSAVSGKQLVEADTGLTQPTTPSDTQPVSAVSLPLPTGASTAANQATGNTSLGTIKTNTDPLVAAAGGGYIRQDSTATIAKESGGNLATIAGKDFATQTTLALIKAKTDNIDVALSTRTKPADTQTVAGTVTANIGTTNGLALDATLTPAKGFKVKDDFQTGEILADQTGAAGVLTFTFSSAVDFIWVTDIGATTTNISRVDPFGGTPAATTGIPVANGTPTPINVTPAATAIKVYAPVGSTITMYGYRRG